MNNSWIVVNQQTTNTIVVSSSYSIVGEINHLANPNYEGVIKALFFLKKIYNLKAKPQGTKAYKEERYNPRGKYIHGDTKHNIT
jgi:hypothetical protein